MNDKKSRADGESNPHSDANSTRSLSSGSAPQERIGPYTLLQKLGEGGMGEVWLAEQKTPVRRRVALEADQAGDGLGTGRSRGSRPSARRWR